MPERVWHPPTTAHNFKAKVEALASDPRGPFVKGSDWECDVKHDAWCDALSGNYAGFCNCDPDITFWPMTTTTRNEG